MKITSEIWRKTGLSERRNQAKTGVRMILRRVSWFGTFSSNWSLGIACQGKKKAIRCDDGFLMNKWN